MVSLLYLDLLFTLIYIGIIIFFLIYWSKISGKTKRKQHFQADVSIVIAARNEEEHILNCLQSCLAQTNPYGELEVIVVDDQSEDDTYDLLKEIKDPRFVPMRLGVYKRTTIKGSKKKAIAYGINHAKGQIIFTTDADCRVPEHWVSSMIEYFKDPKKMLVSGPVKIHNPESFLDYFQSLDLSGNGLINAVALQHSHFHLCNAANLAYRKSLFLDSNAFDDNYQLASGDDVFLVRKAHQLHPAGIAFAKKKESIVSTDSVKSLSSLLSQRIRWAGKMSYITNWKLKLLTALVWIQRMLVYGAPVVFLIMDEMSLALAAFGILFIQWIADFILQWNSNKFYETPNWIKWYLPVSFMHGFYYLFIGLSSIFPIGVHWKGRKV